MSKKLGVVGALIGLLYFSGPSFADSLIGSLANSNGDFAVGSIVVTSKIGTSIPGYFHEKYVYTSADCFTDVLVDHYGPAIDNTDANLLRLEHENCKEIRDGGSSSEDN